MSNGTMSVQISGTFDKLAKQIDKFPNEVIARSADRVLASYGSEARKILGSKQETLFDMNSTKQKFYKGKLIERTSVKNETHGWYKGQNGTRIIGFGYENTAYKRGKRRINYTVDGTSIGYVYSLINNLWGQAVTYKKNGSPFHSSKEGYKRYWGAYPQGYHRKKKETAFNEAFVNQAIEPTMQRAEKDITAILREEGYL